MRTIPIEARAPVTARAPRIGLVGAPNSGKSTLFHRLTGRYVTVSNYPGTSVEITRGRGSVAGEAAEVIDTPGLDSLSATTEDQLATRRLIMSGEVDVLVHVVDAKNLPLRLPLTLQLLEVGLPMVVAANMTDEAERLGIRIDCDRLGEVLGVEVVPIVAVAGKGTDRLNDAIARATRRPSTARPVYADGVGSAIRAVRAALRGAYPVDRTVFAALLLQEDAEVRAAVRAREPDGGAEALRVAGSCAAAFDVPAPYRVAVERHRIVEDVLRDVARTNGDGGSTASERFGQALMRRAVGVPALIVVLFLGLYLFVGRFGGGVLVDWLEGTVFGRHVNPFFERLFAGIPWQTWRSLYVGEYGLLTLGLRYTVAIILPIVGTFFLFFSLLEDSGYLPRLAMLLDRTCKRLGLSGRAVIPLVLGFACDTLATMVTRTLETRRERVLATLLLALAVPCSAQLGVMLVVLAGHPLALGVWGVTLVGSFALVGALGARVLSGERPRFQMEIPPLRLPRVGNVAAKTLARMQWYFLEVLPLFLLASVILWAAALTGALDVVLRGLSPVVGALGLPPEAAQVFLFGFFRRDYGAAGLFDLSQRGMLDVTQLTVAAVTLTLFVPCIAQFLMMIRERGPRTAFAMVAFITPFAFATGFVVHVLLRAVA